MSRVPNMNAGLAYPAIHWTNKSPPPKMTNLDTDAPNLAIYTDDTTDTQLWIGDIMSGGESIDYQVPALDAGTYYFECNVHPAMNGVVRVS